IHGDLETPRGGAASVFGGVRRDQYRAEEPPVVRDSDVGDPREGRPAPERCGEVCWSAAAAAGRDSDPADGPWLLQASLPGTYRAVYWAPGEISQGDRRRPATEVPGSAPRSGADLTGERRAVRRDPEGPCGPAEGVQKAVRGRHQPGAR